MLRQALKEVLEFGRNISVPGPHAGPHSPSTMSAVALITSEDIDNLTTTARSPQRALKASLTEALHQIV